MIAFASLLLILTVSCTQVRHSPTQQVLVVLSMDGFRWDYPTLTQTPNLDSIARVGVKAKAIQSAFPSVTFPNHYTMATGLYPDNHGIVGNSFFDPTSGATFSMRDRATRLNPDFYGGEPIWVTAEKQGIRTATFFWVGSELPIKRIRPSIWKYYDHNFPFAQRIDSVIAWLQLPHEQRPQLIMWYLHEPDAVGHRYGPEHENTLQKVRHLDSLIGVFCRKVRTLDNAEKINLIFTSDHGMGAIAHERTIVLTDHLPAEWAEVAIGWNPVYTIKAIPGYIDSIYLRLNTLDHLQVWKSNQLPEHLNFGRNPRALDLVVVADSAWSINWKPGVNRLNTGGAHGYDPRQMDMHAIFYAVGPAFRVNHEHQVFKNVDLYWLMATILGIEPVATDGVPQRVKGMLAN